MSSLNPLLVLTEVQRYSRGGYRNCRKQLVFLYFPYCTVAPTVGIQSCDAISK